MIRTTQMLWESGGHCRGLASYRAISLIGDFDPPLATFLPQAGGRCNDWVTAMPSLHGQTTAPTARIKNASAVITR